MINLFGPPGVGKTSTAAAIFAEMKKRGILCELVTEFAKIAVWEERNSVMENEIYLFAKKHHNLNILKGKVDYIIIDSPLLLTPIYNSRYGQIEYLNELAFSEFNKYNNINIFLKRRPGVFEGAGRIHLEKESREIALDIDKLYENNKVAEPKIKLLVDELDISNLVDKIIGGDL